MLLNLLILVTLTIVGIEGKCPIFGPNQHCTCRTLTDKSGEDFTILSCQDLDSEEDLHGVLAATKGYQMFELELSKCSLRYLPHDAFVDTTFEVISIQDSSLTALSDTDIAFKGLEKQLHLIEVINCSYTSNWDWTQLSQLSHLLEIHVSDSELIDITEGLTRIQHIDIEAFAFQKNNIHALADKAFGPFIYMERLALDSNYIAEVKRSMFPTPAKNLKILGLSYNNLKDLPTDMFHDMPALKSLYLTGNPLFTIDEAVFRPVWKQLHLFLFYGGLCVGAYLTICGIWRSPDHFLIGDALTAVSEIDYIDTPVNRLTRGSFCKHWYSIFGSVGLLSASLVYNIVQNGWRNRRESSDASIL